MQVGLLSLFCYLLPFEIQFCTGFVVSPCFLIYVYVYFEGFGMERES